MTERGFELYDICCNDSEEGCRCSAYEAGQYIQKLERDLATARLRLAAVDKVVDFADLSAPTEARLRAALRAGVA